METLSLIRGHKHCSQQSDHASGGRVLTQHEESLRLGNLDADKVIKPSGGWPPVSESPQAATAVDRP